MEENFWDRLDRIIKEQGTSRKELAERCSIAVNTIAGWKSRETYPSYQLMEKISKELNTTVGYLLNGNEVTTKSSRHGSNFHFWDDFYEEAEKLSDTELKDLLIAKIENLGRETVTELLRAIPILELRRK